MDSAFDGQDGKVGSWNTNEHVDTFPKKSSLWGGGFICKKENAIPGVKSSRNMQGICKTLAEVKTSRNMQSLLKMYLQQVAEIVIGRMLSGVCFGILDPFMIPVIDNRIVIPDGLTSGPRHMFYLLQYQKLCFFCLHSYVPEKWEEAEHNDYLCCLEILSTVVQLRLIGFHPFNLTGEKGFSFYGLAIGMLEYVYPAQYPDLDNGGVYVVWTEALDQLVSRPVRIKDFIVRGYMKFGSVVPLDAYLAVYDKGSKAISFKDDSNAYALIYCSNALKHVCHHYSGFRRVVIQDNLFAFPHHRVDLWRMITSYYLMYPRLPLDIDQISESGALLLYHAANEEVVAMGSILPEVHYITGNQIVCEGYDCHECFEIVIEGLPFIDIQILAEQFARFGHVVQAQITKNHRCESSTFVGYVGFLSLEEAQVAVAVMHGMTIQDSRVMVSLGNIVGHYEHQQTLSCEICVRGINFSDTNILATLFMTYGDVLDSRIALNRNKTCRGFGFVEFASHEQAQVAVESMNGKTFGGRQIFVEFSTGRRKD